jgi:DNA-binding SARP family transcriptional activator/predicted ATPase
MTDSSAPLTIRLFGSPEACIAETHLALNNQKARALLYYLAATGHPHTRDHLATLLWSESFESNARHSLRSSLYHIRQALHAKGADDVLIADGDNISLKLDEQACDVTSFRRLLTAGSESALAQAVTLYRGPLLQGFTVPDAPMFEEWVRFEESELRQSYLVALQRLASWAESRKSWNEAITYMQRIVQLDPLSEEMQQRLMGLYIHMGAIGQALHHYRQFEIELKQELGLAPSPETQAFISAALESRRITTLQEKTKAVLSARPQAVLPFVGGENLLKQLLSLSKAAKAGQGVTVLLQGEDGIGKSRLLEELINTLSADSSPWIILQGSCSPFDDLLSYGPFLEAFQNAELGDLTDLLSESTIADSNEQSRFPWHVLQALHTLTRSAPLLLTIDDLQWANSSSLHLFGFLSMRLRTMPLMFVGTVQRTEAIPALQRLVTLGRRRGDVQLVSLPPLSKEAVTDLIHKLAISPTSAATFAEWLYEWSGGSPFLLKEIIAQLQAQAVLTPVGNGLRLDVGRWLRWRATCTLPETTHDLVAWRLTNLSSTARSLLDIVAVANQPLPLALLREFPGVQDEQLLSTIEDLIASGLLIETDKDMFALPHHLLREALVLPLSHLRRRRIHRQLAAILEACPALQKNFPLRQIALHAVIGEDVERARRYGLQVLDELAQENPNAQALEFLHHLHDLLAPTASTYEMLRLTHVLGQVHQSLGQLEEATEWYGQYLDLAYKTANPSIQATAHFELGELALVANDYESAAAAAKSGLAIEIPDEDAGRLPLVARGQRLLGAALAMEGSDLAAAEHHLQKAVAAHRLTNNVSDLCATLFELGNVAAQRGELTQALQLYEDAARSAEMAHVHYFLALAYNNFAYHSLLLGNLDEAQRALAKGMTLAESHEMFGALLHLYSTRGEISLYLGEWAEASEAFQHGLSLAEELGNLERQAGYRAGLALVARGQGDLEGATTLLEEALSLITERGFWHLHTRIQLWLVETLLLCGHLNEAELRLKTALATAQVQGRVLLHLQGERLHARLLAARGNWSEANTNFAQALEEAAGLNLPLEVARTQAAWGESALRYAQTPHNTHNLLSKARKTFTAYKAQAELKVVMNMLKM